MNPTRKRFSGTANIIRFNRGKYAAAASVVFALTTIAVVNADVRVPVLIAASAITIGVMASLGVSYWVHDTSDLHDFRWSNSIQDNDCVAVVHAGFDEVSGTLRPRHNGNFHTVSFFNRLEIIESSIRRAQSQTTPPEPAKPRGGQPLLAPGEFDWVIAFMCLHELRTEHARQQLLTELADSLTEGGQLLVVEHLRDLPNAIAFSIGVFHFMPKSSWDTDFAAAGLRLVSEKKTTPFVSEFLLNRASQT